MSLEMANPTEPTVEEAFTAFFEGWLIRGKTFLEQLDQVSLATQEEEEEQHKHFIEQVVGHYRQYYEEKAKAASEDVFIFFSPPWMSSFERTLIWMSGFRPSLVFRLIESSVGGLTAEQVAGIGRVKEETRRKERKIEDAMARAQESVAGPPLCGLVRRVERLVDGEVSEFGAAMDVLRKAMVAVLEDADELRGSTMRGVLEILEPLQSVKFLAAAVQFQVKARNWGLKRTISSITVGTEKVTI